MLYLFTRQQAYPPATNDSAIIEAIKAENSALIERNNEMIARLSDSIKASLANQQVIFQTIQQTRDESIQKYNSIRAYHSDTLDSVYNVTRLRVRSNYLNGRYRPG